MVKPVLIPFVAWFFASSCNLPDDANLHVRNVKFLDLNVDSTAEICDDFQRYACGNSFRNVPLKKVPAEGINWMRVRSERIDQQLLDTLNGIIPSSAVVRKASDLFRGCTEAKISQRATFDAVNVELSRLGFDSIKSPSPPADFDPTAAIGRLLRLSTTYNNFFMMRVEVIEDSQNPGKYVPFIMSDSPYQATIDDNFAEKVCMTLKIKCTTEVEKAVEFIRKMQEITSNVKGTTQMAGWNRKSLKSLSFKTNDCFLAGNKGTACLWRFDWHRFFQNLFGSLWDGSKVDDLEFFIYVTNFRTLMRAMRLLQNTEEAVVARALWLVAVQFASPLGSQQLQTIYKEGVNDPLGIMKLAKDKQCLAIVKDLFRPLVAQKLVKDLTDEDESELNKIQKVVKEEFLKLVQNAEWLSESARAYLAPKIQNMRIHIPYFNVPRREIELTDDYPEVKIDLNAFYQTYTSMVETKRDRQFARIFDETPSEIRLEYQPPMSLYPNQQTQITYYPLLNEIEIPVFMIGYPYYYGHQFGPLNIGGLGFQLARQMARAVNSTNIKFNERAKIEYGKWQAKDQTNYENRSSPLKEAFSSEMPKWYQSVADLNELIIDNIGLSVGFEIMKNLYPDPQKTNGDTIKKHNEHELFTLGVAMTMCRAAPSTESDRYINSPNRLNELFKRSIDFISTWNCDGTAMDERAKWAMFP